ncbi:MAG: hypothetical protein L0227_02575 [Chloroflexi bacterium]|nr:hypothetical protein [Chloroflexota bacterium]
MVKWIVTLSLWFLSGWTLGSFLAWSLDAPEIIGPLLGLVAVGIVVAPSWPVARRRSAPLS